MTREYKVTVKGQVHTVVVSDETEALLAAKTAGKASVELWNRQKDGGAFLTGYAVESTDDINPDYLEQVVRRHLGLPWEILRTRQLLIREFQKGDESMIPTEVKETGDDQVFRCPQRLQEYIRCQYGFYGYGIWAVTDQKSGVILGKAGVFNLQWKEDARLKGLELGYHIFTPYRRKGYAREACEGILAWCRKSSPFPDSHSIYAKTDPSNHASVMLLKQLGFQFIDQRYSESGQKQSLFVRC